VSWLALLSAVIGLISRAVGFLGDRRLIDAGEADAVVRILRATLADTERARRAADAVDNPESDADRAFAERVRRRFQRPDE